MGKPYASEMLQLRRTAAWGVNSDIEDLRQTALATRHLPLMAVGSGGSLTAAHFLASTHRHFTGQIAQVSTPLEVAFEPIAKRCAVWLLSAGGGNVDILSAFSTLAGQEPSVLQLLIGRKGSPLARRADKHSHVRLYDFASPAGKDGFLATNSLLAFCVLVGLAYEAAYTSDRPLEHDLATGLTALLADEAKIETWKSTLLPLWGRPDLIVLHGAATRVGAIDLESKFTEAALGQIQYADYRNFAHGRHVWLAKHGDETAVLALTTPADRQLATETLAQIPESVPTARIDLEGGFLDCALAALVVALQATAFAGAARSIDPGRPGVPEFGRALYHLRPAVRARRGGDTDVSIERKAGAPVRALAAAGTLEGWRRAHEAFQAELASAPFQGVVFDYDGTLVETRDRFRPPMPEVVEAISHLIEAGVVVGIATGRGGSVAEDLRKVLPAESWRRVVVGYYNGSEIGLLEEAARPDAEPVACEALERFLTELLGYPELPSLASLRIRRWQVTLEARGAPPEDRLWDIANQAKLRCPAAGITVARSGHSIDVLAPGVTKMSVVSKIREMLSSPDARVITVGDRGRWPGNDFSLLSAPHALSVDETSPDPLTCWNLAPRGFRGVAATLDYLGRLGPTGGGVSWFRNGVRR